MPEQKVLPVGSETGAWQFSPDGRQKSIIRDPTKLTKVAAWTIYPTNYSFPYTYPLQLYTYQPPLVVPTPIVLSGNAADGIDDENVRRRSTRRRLGCEDGG